MGARRGARENEYERSYSMENSLLESVDGLFLNFKLCLYTTSACIRNQENVELRIFNAPFLRGTNTQINVRVKSA